MDNRAWVAMGEVSRLPVAAFWDIDTMKFWLSRRRGTSMVRVFELREMPDGAFSRMELDVEELLK